MLSGGESVTVQGTETIISNKPGMFEKKPESNVSCAKCWDRICRKGSWQSQTPELSNYMANEILRRDGCSVDHVGRSRVI